MPLGEDTASGGGTTAAAATSSSSTDDGGSALTTKKENKKKKKPTKKGIALVGGLAAQLVLCHSPSAVGTFLQSCKLQAASTLLWEMHRRTADHATDNDSGGGGGLEGFVKEIRGDEFEFGPEGDEGGGAMMPMMPPVQPTTAAGEVLDSAGMTPGGAAAMLAHLSPLQRARLLSAMRDEDKRHAMLDCMDDESKAAAVAEMSDAEADAVLQLLFLNQEEEEEEDGDDNAEGSSMSPSSPFMVATASSSIC